ncbi:hypothetical protein B0H14DRAFT_3438861 [Mycena olivaceomarginata]|nr:hypothetical protein B0H14DRAFT_3438861 [Mycena olivaceomarginata]
MSTTCWPLWPALLKLHLTSRLTTPWRTLRHPPPALRRLLGNACQFENDEYILKRSLVDSDFAVFASVLSISGTSAVAVWTVSSSLFFESTETPSFPDYRDLNGCPQSGTGLWVHSISSLMVVQLKGSYFLCSHLPFTPTNSPACLLTPKQSPPALRQPLAAGVPDVKSLTLHSDEGKPDIDISGGIHALTQLQRASFDFAIGPEILTYLAGLPNIVSLGLSEESFRCISEIQTIADTR